MLIPRNRSSFSRNNKCGYVTVSQNIILRNKFADFMKTQGILRNQITYHGRLIPLIKHPRSMKSKRYFVEFWLIIP